MPSLHPITPCLWFDDQAEEAAQHYTAIFRISKITEIARFGKASHELYREREGKVMTVAFKLDGRPFTALNGGPMFKFNEAISLQVICETQEEIDHYWEKLSAGGDPKAERATQAMLKMKKFDIAELRRAFAA